MGSRGVGGRVPILKLRKFDYKIECNHYLINFLFEIISLCICSEIKYNKVPNFGNIIVEVFINHNHYKYLILN